MIALNHFPEPIYAAQGTEYIYAGDQEKHINRWFVYKLQILR